MATPADVGAFRATQGDVVTLATADLARWWADLDLRSVAEARAAVPALELFVADLVATYGDAAALAAADWYDELRAQAEVPGRFRASMAEPAPAGQAAAVARWAAGPLFGDQPDPSRVLRMLSGAVQRLVLQPGRATIARSTVGDPARPRWARVPGRSDPCAFCRMLASRGAVYGSDRAAGRMNDYHSKCGCVPTPVWPGQREPYDVDALLQQYNDARAKAGGDPKDITAQMREDLGVS